jgi:hypothetical protein
MTDLARAVQPLGENWKFEEIDEEAGFTTSGREKP